MTNPWSRIPGAMKLKYGNVDFYGERKTGTGTNTKLNPLMTLVPEASTKKYVITQETN